MKYDVFISYKSQSINVVKAIVHVLENENIRCWYAPRDLDNQAAGKDYDDKIAEAITNCNMLVVVLSNAALTSDWVKAEVGMAQKQKKLVIPYVVSELQVENGLRMRLESKHWIDAYPNPERKFSLLLRNIKIFLNEASSGDQDSSEDKRFQMEDTEDCSVDFDYDEGLALLEAKEYNDAALAFMASAERGNKDAKDQLCQMFYDIEGCEDQIQEEIWDNIERQAKDGHPYANFLLHCKVYKDASNNLVSFEYLKKAIKNNTIGLAFLRMGIQYNWGMGVKQSHTLGMHYYRRAYELGCKEACSYMGQEYRHGSDKIAKDEDKAVELLTKGIEMGDNRSYTQLVYYYLFDKHDKKMAIEMAERAIKNGYSKGYSLMGEVYLGDYDSIEQDQEEAAKWFKEGLRHDDKNAYGSLALLYYNQGEYDDAFDMARKGRYANNSDSFLMLGLLYENKGKLDEAWQCFSEQYDRFGIGADNLANLVMDRGYRPKDLSDEGYQKMLDELEQKLEILARNYNQSCLEALIKFYSYRADGIATLDYDIVKKVPKASDFIKLGAEMGIPEMMFYLGNTIIKDKDNEKVNPYKGLEWLEKAANANHEEAIKCLLDLYSRGHFRDDEELKRLIMHERMLALDGNNAALNILLDSDRFSSFPKDCDLIPLVNLCISRQYYNKGILPTILNHADISSEEAKYSFAKLLVMIIDETLHDAPTPYQEMDIPMVFTVANKLYSVKENIDYDIPETIIGKLKDIVILQTNKKNLGYLRKLDTSIILNVLFPNYNEKEIFRNFSCSSSENQMLFYARNYANDKEIDICLQDDFLEKLHSLFIYDESLQEDSGNYDTDVNELIQAMANYQSSYFAICKKNGISPIEYNLPKKEYLFPYMPSSVCAKISFDTLALFLTLYKIMPEIYDSILPILRNDEQILNYCETLSDQDLQLFLIELVEIKIDIETIMLTNYGLYKNYKEKNKKPIAEYLNKILDKYGDKVTSKENPYLLDNLPDFSEITPNRTLNTDVIYDSNDEEDKQTVSQTVKKEEEAFEDDEFERLLNDFINSSSEEEATQQNA